MAYEIFRTGVIIAACIFKLPIGAFYFAGINDVGLGAILFIFTPGNNNAQLATIAIRCTFSWG
ncbi:hypothetical protein ATN89_04665 [Comamonas thiooxydans]|nr:hypothetical protein ATN89_04665 [Comamonas thiooxydans]